MLPEVAVPIAVLAFLATWLIPHVELRRGAEADNLSFYDALYVALADQLGVPLLTSDARLSRATGLPCQTELV